MRKYKISEIKALVFSGYATDITMLNFDALKKWNDDHDVEKIGYASGACGISGGVVRDRNTGELFAITKRNTALLFVF